MEILVHNKKKADVTISLGDYFKEKLLSLPPDPQIGYLGFAEKKAMKIFLEWITAEDTAFAPVEEEEILEAVREAMKLTANVVEEPQKIFILPTKVSLPKSMRGVAGYCFWKNTIIVTVTAHKGWQKAVVETLCHEISHSLALNAGHERHTILDHLLFEGLAQHFQEALVGNLPFVTMTRDAAMQYYAQLEKQGLLDSTNDDLYRNLFFGSPDGSGTAFPRWTGYAIGFFLAEELLENLHPERDWKKVHQDPDFFKGRIRKGELMKRDNKKR